MPVLRGDVDAGARADQMVFQAVLDRYYILMRGPLGPAAGLVQPPFRPKYQDHREHSYNYFKLVSGRDDDQFS